MLLLQAYSAYLAYFNVALKKYNATGSAVEPHIIFQQCNAQVLCGQNYMASGSAVLHKQGPASCMQISGIDLANSVATASALKSLQVYECVCVLFDKLCRTVQAFIVAYFIQSHFQSAKTYK